MASNRTTIPIGAANDSPNGQVTKSMLEIEGRANVAKLRDLSSLGIRISYCGRRTYLGHPAIAEASFPLTYFS